MKRIAIYRRVSTDKQDVASQDHAIQQWMAAWIACRAKLPARCRL
jgi:DNA invertase Pin-like site-specific DNA recombinase